VWFSTQENPTMTAFTKLKLVNAQADQKTPMVVRRSKLTGKLDLQIALAKAQTEGADFVASRKKTVIDRETGLKKRVDAAMTVRQWWWTNQAGAVVLGLRYGSKPIEIAKGIEVPRDRHGSFQPQLIPKHQTRWAGFDDKIISLYARGMTVREIQAHLEEIYGTEVSPSLISSVTDAVADEVKAWQARPLEPIYPIVYLDCIHVKVREGAVRVKAVYLAIGITMTGEKEVLGLWLAQTEGAKFWLQVVTELRNRGVQDIFIACVDGLKGFPDAIEAVFPKAVVQLCIVHMVRHSLNYVSWKRRKEVAADLRRIYTATTAEEAELMLGEFEARWDAEYLPIGQSWRRNWSRLTPFFDYPPEIRKVIYTTNAIESVNMSLRKLTKNRGSFPSDEALTKLFYLALRNISQKWTMPIRDWKAALTRFTIQFGDRISVN
jgi:putative transposase